MKKYINYIKESKEQDDLILHCIRCGEYNPLMAFDKDCLTNFLINNYRFSIPTKCTIFKYFNSHNFYIEYFKEYYVIDNIFKNLEEVKSKCLPERILLFKYSGEYIMEYDRITEILHIDYVNFFESNIYNKYDVSFNTTIDKIILNFAEEYFKLNIKKVSYKSKEYYSL